MSERSAACDQERKRRSGMIRKMATHPLFSAPTRRYMVQAFVAPLFLDDREGDWEIRVVRDSLDGEGSLTSASYDVENARALHAALGAALAVIDAGLRKPWLP